MTCTNVFKDLASMYMYIKNKNIVCYIMKDKLNPFQSFSFALILVSLHCLLSFFSTIYFILFQTTVLKLLLATCMEIVKVNAYFSLLRNMLFVSESVRHNILMSSAWDENFHVFIVIRTTFNMSFSQNVIQI